jgi:hypothetical protein
VRPGVAVPRRGGIAAGDRSCGAARGGRAGEARLGSHRREQRPRVLWTLNDAGNPPVVFAIGEHGEDLASFRVAGVANGDWEDIGAARLDGTDVLVVANTGDNLHRRPQRAVLILPEPTVDPAKRQVRGTIRPLRTVTFRYPDKPHDCEAIGVEPDASRALLIAKTWWGSAPVFALDLRAGSQVRVVEPLGSVPVSWATAASISADGRRLVVGTYGAAYLFRRGVGEPWATALGRPPETIAVPVRPQGEGIAFARDGRSIFASSEGRGSVLWRVPLP